MPKSPKETKQDFQKQKAAQKAGWPHNQKAKIVNPIIRRSPKE